MSPATDTSRHRATNDRLGDFMDTILVECPRCGGCAVNRQLDDARPAGWFASRRLTCASCGHSDRWQERTIHRAWYDARDDYFGLPLWLRTRCLGRILWVYNERQLDVLEGFVAADLRERRQEDVAGWANQSYTSRLPAWIKSAKNRDDVLKALRRLRGRLP